MKIASMAQNLTSSISFKLLSVAFLIVFCSMEAATAIPPPQNEFKVTTVYLVRHAEKAAAPAADPPLTEAGIKRAEELARTLSKAGIKTISTSQFLRTKQTAEPLAKALGIPNTVIPVKMDTMNSRALSPEYLKQISDLISASTGSVLIVGHSNTIPELIKALGGDIVPTIDDPTYDDLFVVTVYAKGKAKVAHLKQ